MGVAKRPGHGGARPGAGRKRSLLDPRQIAIDLERADLDALTEIAQKRETSVAALVRTAVQQFLRRNRR